MTILELDAPVAPHTVAPQRIAADTYLIPSLLPAEPGTFVYLNSMVILGREPVIVDTGAPLFREQWIESVTSLLEPADIRWIFVSHDDGDHVGNLVELLRLAPNATVVANFFTNERMRADRPGELPIDRQVWLDAGDTIDAGDRTLRLFRPPIFDGPTTRGVYDERSGVMWAVDSFAALTIGAVDDVSDIPGDLYDGSFELFNSLVSPWHSWLDPAVYGRHVDAVESMAPTAIASAHGAVLRGQSIPEGFHRLRRMAGQPNTPAPGQETLDHLIALTLGASERP